WTHLEHISNRNNVWYTGFGHLYAYNFLQSTYPNMNLSSHDIKEPVAQQFTLFHNYPNPFNPTTIISYDLPERAQVTLDIYDILGKQIKTLVNQSQDAGNKIAMWDGTDDLGSQVSAGVYLYQIQAGEFSQTRKMLLLK
ncbi:MAG: T9SS type A sorting domain-containing protein, partial [Candidatus Marinimicrobia bacterium]|nr:T9SS type A sorting domain-containing protein [Candidatus Neomarinimicrobiota bacterium]